MTVQEIMPVHFRTAEVNGLSIFYREAGPPGAPVVLLLHGFPTSSHMFRDLIPLLADRYHVIAPDYPGFGYSAAPRPQDFRYTFDRVADVMEHFTDALGLRAYTLYLQDFGGPIGLRLATRHPERVRALIIQNANAYDEGVSQGVRDVVLRAYTDHSPAVVAKLRTFFELPITKHQYLDGVPDPSRVSPDAWTHAQWGMDRPGNKEIQLALHSNYGSNVERYDEWHRYFRAHQPPTLVVWGKGDAVFLPAGADAYRKDLRNIEVHLLDAGHFALETNVAEIAAYMRPFLAHVQAGSTASCSTANAARWSFDGDIHNNSLALSPDQRTAVASYSGCPAVVVYDLITRQVRGVLDQFVTPRNVVFEPSGRFFYLSDSSRGVVEKIDATSLLTSDIFVVGPGAFGTTVSSDGSTLYVNSEAANTVTVFDLAHGRPAAVIPGFAQPRQGVRLSPDGAQLFVTNFLGDKIVVVVVATRRIVGEIGGFQKIRAISITRDGRTLFAGNSGTNSIAVVDLASRRIVRQIAVGRDPYGAALTPDERFVYSGNLADNSLTVIALPSYKVVATVTGLKEPRQAIVFTRDSASAYVLNRDLSVSRVDVSTQRVVETITPPFSTASTVAR